jgi:hypothetical protein
MHNTNVISAQIRVRVNVCDFERALDDFWAPLVALQFEERDLVATLGASFDQYRARVPILVPGWPRRRRQRQVVC